MYWIVSKRSLNKYFQNKSFIFVLSLKVIGIQNSLKFKLGFNLVISGIYFIEEIVDNPNDEESDYCEVHTVVILNSGRKVLDSHQVVGSVSEHQILRLVVVVKNSYELAHVRALAAQPCFVLSDDQALFVMLDVSVLQLPQTRITEHRFSIAEFFLLRLSQCE